MLLQIERGSTRSHVVENTFWGRLWTCRKKDCRMRDLQKEGVTIGTLLAWLSIRFSDPLLRIGIIGFRVS